MSCRDMQTGTEGLLRSELKVAQQAAVQHEQEAKAAAARLAKAVAEAKEADQSRVEELSGARREFTEAELAARVELRGTDADCIARFCLLLAFSVADGSSS